MSFPIDLFAGLQDSGTALNDLHDVYIAATARTEQRPVLTANVDRFERIDSVHVVDWEAY
jgi:tRNA(fMet)-specific endonuclease VapC